MRVPRLFVDQSLAAGQEIQLRDDALHYARNVLRLESGALLRLFDGSGNEYAASITAIEKRAMVLQLGDQLPGAAELALPVHLGIGLARGERMDWVVQKCTELGVTTISPLLLSRCNAKLESARADNRLRHWRQVAISACEQCGSNRLPQIDLPLSLDEWLQQREALPGLVLHTSDSDALQQGTQPQGMRLLIGPEGGLDEQEFRRACAAGFRPWSLGPRIMRTETAPVAALAILQYLWGDMGRPVPT